MLRVTSPHNPRLREAARLIESSRDRRKLGKCVLEGEHLIGVYTERLGAPELVIVAEDALMRPELAALASRLEAVTIVVPVKAFGELASLPAGVGMIAVVPTPHPVAMGPSDFCVVLEDLQDPGNVGSILRSAAAAGVDRVVLSKGSAFAWSPKVLRSAQGAHFLLAIDERVDIAAWCAEFRGGGGRVMALVAQGGDPLSEVDLRGRVAVVIGNEGAGLSHELLQHATLRVTIPMPGGMESLNAAAAAAVCLYECVRQRASVAAGQ